MKKIALVGFTNYVNFGDQFITQSVEHLVKLQGDEYQPYFCDFTISEKGLKKLMAKCMSKGSSFIGNKTRRYRLLYKALCVKHKGIYRSMLSGADAVIISCGSFKYGTQLLWAYYSMITEVASELRIPVMFNAMNVQKYDPSDWRCMCLKKHVNLPVVKMFTSRDGMPGVERFTSDYRTNEDLLVYPAGDPAFWLGDVYKDICENADKKTAGDEQLVGIGLLKGANFKAYGGSMTEEEFLQIYCDLLKLLDQKGIHWELFTNGLKSDYIFGEKILKALHSDKSIRVPESAENLAKILTTYSRILGGRLHACIGAYALGIPFAGYIWDEKLVHFAEMSKTEGIFAGEKELSGEKLFELLERTRTFTIDEENKEYWKQETFRRIGEFLANV